MANVAPAKMSTLGPSIEARVRNAYFSPSPHAYNPVKPEIGMKGGRISEAQLPSTIEHQAREKACVPDPGSYDTSMRDFALPDGGRLNRNPPQEKFKLDECPIPPPGTYGVPKDPANPRMLYGSFGKDPRVTKFIQDEVQRSRSVPAPGEHEVMEAMDNLRPFCPEGGRYLDQGRSNGYFDNAAKLSAGRPDPGRYDLPGAMKQNKSAGKLVWKYQSETLEKTKKIITKVVGNGNENPAPGHYTLPEPPPTTTTTKFLGRDVGPAMPHPYAYNCAPDHARRYSAPVLEQNSGDQIYGRDLRRGSIGSREGSRAAKAKASADEVSAAHMPITLAERDIEQPRESVQWRTGGFSTLQRAVSAPGVSRKKNAAMEQTKGHYPSLSKHFGRHGKTFTPMAPKRLEIVKTHDSSLEYQNLQRSKWALGAIAANLGASTAAALETLDEQKLRDQAMFGLMDKAKFRMRMEGLAPDQQDLVLAELPGVLAEECQGRSPSASQGYSQEPSARGFAEEASTLGEPFAEPFPAPSDEGSVF